MKHLVLLLLVQFTFNAIGQSFEGTLTYKVEFEVTAKKIGEIEITKKDVVDKMKSDGNYFDEIVVRIKGGRYVKQMNSSSQTKMIYDPTGNSIYTIQKGVEYVVIADAANHSPIGNGLKMDMQEPTIEQLDSTVVINGTTCSAVRLSWGKIGSELYFYNKGNLKLDPSLFEKHNYEYFNDILKITKAYPMEIEKSLSNFVKIRMTLVKVNKDPVKDNYFALPEMTEADKEYSDLMMRMTGKRVKKIVK